MAILIKELKNLRLLSASLKDLPSSEIKEVIDKLTQIYDEVKEREEQANALVRQKEEGISKIKQIMEENSLTAEEMFEAIGRPVKQRKMKARYRFTDANGNVHEWTGQGRTPRLLSELFELDGTSKEDYLISDDTEISHTEAEQEQN